MSCMFFDSKKGATSIRRDRLRIASHHAGVIYVFFCKLYSVERQRRLFLNVSMYDVHMHTAVQVNRVRFANEESQIAIKKSKELSEPIQLGGIVFI